MIFLEIKIALTEMEHALAERLCAADNAKYGESVGLKEWLSGKASHSVVKRLHEMEAQTRQEVPG